MAKTRIAGLTWGGDSVRRVRAEVERLAYRVRSEAIDLTGGETGPLGKLFAESRRIRGDLRSRAEEAVRSAEDRARDIASGVEERVTGAIEPVKKRLNVASQKELSELKERVAELEKRINELNKTAQAA